MTIERKSDIQLNVILPLLFGMLIYYSAVKWTVPAFVRNYFPDALWAYAFISVMLLIWNREIRVFWIMVVFVFSAIFELLQYFHKIAGTGDLLDVVTYYLAFLLALKLNPVFKNS
jgi:hypothetical protein